MYIIYFISYQKNFQLYKILEFFNPWIILRLSKYKFTIIFNEGIYMKKFTLKFILLATLFLLTISTTIFAITRTSSGTGCIFISSTRGGIETEGDIAMTNAKNVYDDLGYFSTITKDPSSSLRILSNLLTHSVQLYCCHGNSGLIEFIPGGLTIGPSFTSSAGQEFHSIDNINLSHIKLITLAACNTAGDGSNNYNNTIAYNMALQGAQMVLGWHSQINAFSLPDWLNNFHYYLMIGNNPLDAANLACSNHSYLNSNVKNFSMIYSSLTPLSSNELSTLSSNSCSNTVKSINLTKYSNLDKSEINHILKDYNPNFSLNDYEKTISTNSYSYDIKQLQNNSYSYIDYIYKIGDYLTNSAYIITLDSSEKINKIIDNTIDLPIQQTKNINSFIVSEELKQHYLALSKNESKYNHIIDETIQFYYNINTEEKMAIITLSCTDENQNIQNEVHTYAIDN